MKVFIAGGSGAIGRVLVPMLVGAGHDVVALTRSPQRAALLQGMGAAPKIGDVFDEASLTRTIAATNAELVIHQLTAFGTTGGDPYAETIRARTEGTRSLVAAALAAGARRFLAQSISFMCSPHGSGLTDEDTPLYLDGPPSVRAPAEAVASVEGQALAAYGSSCTVLRYGWFYGPGTSYDENDTIPTALRTGKMPIAGSGAGTYSFINLRDAAAATMKAVELEPSGIYNIVDDSPVRWSEFLPVLASLLDAPAPSRAEESVARERFGDLRVYYWNEQLGASNARAKRDLDWQPIFSSWRRGFEDLYST